MAKKPTKGTPRKAPKSNTKSSAKSQPKAKASSPKPPKPTSTEPNFFQKNASWLTPLGIIVGFLVLLLMYFTPLSSGESLQMGDVQAFAGMSKETTDYREATGEQAFWTERMFSGMPTFHTGLSYPNNWIKGIFSVYFDLIPPPVSFLMLLFLGFFLMLRALDMDYGVSALGGIAFAFSSYFFIIMAAGHTSKAVAIALMCPTIAGMIMAYRGHYLGGALVAALGLAFELAANHLQITYYLGITMVVLGIAFLINAIRTQTLPQFGVATGVLMLAAVLGAGPSMGMLLTNAEYAEETTRGPSELTPLTGEEKSDGLDLDYAFDWSFEQAEVFTMLIPNLYGGASATPLNRSYEGASTIRQVYGGKIAPSYWGDQRFTSGPVYVGAGIFFLFVLGLLVVEGPLKWGLLVATILACLLSMGDHLLWFNQPIFEYVPVYNKFRAVAMTLVIAELAIPFLGVLALYQISQPEKFNLDKESLTKKLYIAAGITGGLCVLFWLLGGTLFDFSGAGDDQILNADIPDDRKNMILDALRDYRIDMLKADALRSLLFVLLTAGAVWLWLRGNIKYVATIAIIGAVTLADMWVVNKRYLNDDNFGKRKSYDEVQPSPADSYILDDEDHFRVLNLSVNTFNSATTAYFHNDIGGYHPAKLGRYQELIERQITPELAKLRTGLSQPNMTPLLAAQAFNNVNVLNMLNLKYLIINPNAQPLENPARFGPVWFVDQFEMVADADAEMAKLGQINPRRTAVIDQRYQDQVAGLTIKPDSTARIQLAADGYSPNLVKYTSNASTAQLAVFSEIYYNEDKGWNAYLDGAQVPHFRTNYVLRGMVIPPGQHEIEFRMEPGTYFMGETISLISSIILLLAMAGYGFMSWRNRNSQPKAEESQA